MQPSIRWKGCAVKVGEKVRVHYYHCGSGRKGFHHCATKIEKLDKADEGSKKRGASSPRTSCEVAIGAGSYIFTHNSACRTLCRAALAWLARCCSHLHERFSCAVTRYPFTSAVRPSFLAGTTESRSFFGRAPCPQKHLMVLPRFSSIFGLVALTALYFFAAKLGLGLAFLHASASPVWPPAGIALATVLLLTAVLTLTATRLAAAIAERRRAEAALEAQKSLVEAANQAKDNFLAMLSHELRTPLSPVLLAVENLQKQWRKNDEAAAALEIIRRNIRVERHLIEDLLDVTRISKGKLVLNLTSVSAHGQIRDVVETCRSAWSGKKIRMQLDLMAGDRFVVADEARFQQIVWNLVQNAIKFSRDEGEIKISTANESPGQLTVIVQDQGIGIEPEAMKTIFNPFEQNERSLKQRFGGLGLGLAISKSLAEAHGATLTAMSEGLNRGATFRLTIKTSPLVAHHGTISLPVQARVRWMLRILLVDDHIDTCNVMAKLLAARGHKITVAHDMKSALERIEGGGFDVLISDVGLPDGRGTELISKSKNRLVGIAMSGFGTDADARRSLEAGFSQHLIKPVTMEKLDAALQTALRETAGDQR